MYEIDRDEIDRENQEIKQYLQNLLNIHDNCKDRTLRQKIRVELKKIGIDFIEFMDMESIEKFRKFIIENSQYDLDELDKKIQNSEIIRATLQKNLMSISSLSKRMDMYRTYKNWCGGNFSITLADPIINDEANEKALNNSFGTKFLIEVSDDIAKSKGELINDTAKEIFGKIMARPSIRLILEGDLNSRIKECSTTDDKVKLFEEYSKTNSLLMVQVLNNIIRNCTKRELADSKFLSFLVNAKEKVSRLEYLTVDLVEMRERTLKLINGRQEVQEFENKPIATAE